ncbi:MAG: hypothetical protein KAX38_06425, partial [Candidatus Krumholzibacteria bacterium]|nr:hypothetical protein [Candidatus Krumholzibacteria bacterium]
MRSASRLLAFISISAALLAVSDLLHAGEVSVTFRFGEPRIESLDQGFSRIIFPATVQAGKAGEPSFPFSGVQILLPPGEMVSGVRIERRGWKLITGMHRLHPSQHPVPGVEADRRPRTFLYNSAAYELDRWVHPPVSEFSTHYLKGHAIAVGSFSPVGFHPSARKVGYYKEVEVTVETRSGTPSIKALDFLRTDDKTHERLSRLVDNPYALSSYGTIQGAAKDAYECLIITRSDLEDDFAALGDFYNRRGMRTSIMTIEDIESIYGGNDTPEKIRNAITSEYTAHGITHVLLGGDGDGPPEDPKIVPYRGLCCGVQSSYFYEDDNIPADHYFAALDGSWNDDGDSLWGEPGEEDFYSEIAIGRACVDTPEEIAHFT